MLICKRFYNIMLFEVLLVLSCTVCLASSSSNFTDKSALLAIKSAIRIDPNNNNDSSSLVRNWNTATNFCNWVGVTCSARRQRVVALHLPNRGLEGTIAPHVGNLSFLATLILSNNSLYGHVPGELGHLRRLRTLILQLNQLEGVIPSSLQHCRKLELVALAYNKLSGEIPKELGMLSKLGELSLSKNGLTGTIPSSLANISTLKRLVVQDNSLRGTFPLVIFNISSIQLVSLENNSLSGTLPTDICLNCPQFQELWIQNNQLTGQIPSNIDQCKELRSLSLSYNRFHGSIPKELWSLNKLKILYLSGNKFPASTIHPALVNLSSLEKLSLDKNQIHGSIPNELGRLSNLSVLSMQHNYLSGVVPKSIFNSSSLRVFAVLNNTLSGNLPSGSGLWLPNLEQLFFALNQLGGNIPIHLSNSSKLFRVDLSNNLFTGIIPMDLGKLQNLRFLSLQNNRLTKDPRSPKISFLTALVSCRFLEKLSIEYNPIGGILPTSIGNFSTSLQVIYAARCKIEGSIPTEIGNLRNLYFLVLSNNNLNGVIPRTIQGLGNLQRLYLDDNMIEGPIPNEICHLQYLGEMSLQYNKLSGSIPNCIGNLRRMQRLYLCSNALGSSIPMSLWTLGNLLFLNLSSNSFGGYLPSDMGMVNVIENMDLSRNKILGNIPSIIGDFKSLNFLDLSRNSFQGSIPQSFGDMVTLEYMDLSYNNLSGAIPKSLEALVNLKYFNLSFNKLSGEIPYGGPFINFTQQSFMENDELCGNQIPGMPPCTSRDHGISRTKQIVLRYILPTIAALVIFVSLFFMLKRHQKCNTQTPILFSLLPTLEHKMISYHELRRATNNFSEANVLGVGSYGSVYKGMLSDGTIAAIKVLNLQLEGAFKSFDAECKVFRTVRHRNLVKIISSCSNPEMKALVMQYMPNGSLEKWLYSENCCLDLLQRISILIDVASALEYLHHGQSEPVVHCDIKPNNVLLDEDLIAHVGDFGIARILAKNKDATQTKTLGTVGYIAPEYGSEGRVSPKGDIYSYGIMLLEIITGRKPTDNMFVGECSLRHWVNASLPNAITEVVDGNLLMVKDGEARDIIAKQGCLLSIMEIGLECSRERAEERIDIKDVVVKLNKIKLELLSYEM